MRCVSVRVDIICLHARCQWISGRKLIFYCKHSAASRKLLAAHQIEALILEPLGVQIWLPSIGQCMNCGAVSSHSFPEEVISELHKIVGRGVLLGSISLHC